MMSDSWPSVPAILDKEVEKVEEDRFGHADLEEALRHLIEGEEYNPPYSIGLLGEWGSGKSSVKSFYLDRLKRSRDRNTKVYPISFNAWRYGNDNVKRALLRHLFLRLGGREEHLYAEIYNQYEKLTPEAKSFWQVLRDFRAPVMLISLTLALVCLIAFLLPLLTAWSLGIRGLSNTALLGAAATLALPAAITAFLRLPMHSNVTQIDFPKTTTEQFERFLKTQLEEFANGKAKLPNGESSKGYERVVIFVDDLDRLTGEEMVVSIDAIRGFMELQAEAEDKPKVVFVISSDEEKVADALEDRRKRTGAEVPAGLSSKDEARRYLDRIFQFRLEIPPLPKRDMRDYAEQLARDHLKWLVDDLKENTRPVINTMIHPRVQSPRTVIHILNSFARAWWLARKREARSGTGEPGGLKPTAVTKHPRTLAALSALDVDFPEFYRDLKRRPELLNAFITVFINRGDIRDYGEGIRFALNKYADGDLLTVGRGKPESDGDSGSDSNSSSLPEVKSRYRPLHTYLSSVRILRRPSDLRPLLYLSQNAREQDLPEGAVELRDYLIQGATQAVLGELGTTLGGKPLTETNIDTLADVLEDIREEESEDTQDLVGRVLSDISDQLPESRSNEIYTELAAQLAESSNLRANLGTSRIAELLPKFPSDQRNAVASSLALEVLQPASDIELRTTGQAVPSLDTAIDMVRTSVPAILETRTQAGLNTRADARVLQWLWEPRVSSQEQEHKFDFTELDGWVAEVEEPEGEMDLLLELGSSYTEKVASLARSEVSSTVADSEVLRRTKRVIESLLKSGGTQQQTAWEQLSRTIASPEESVHELAARIGREHVREATGQQFNDFMTNFGDALSAERVVFQSTEAEEAPTS